MTRSRNGFTLIELLIVVVIIGILAALAIPKFSDTKRKAYIASMKADLRNTVTYAESYFNDNGTYVGFAAPSASAGVILTLGTVSGTGWTATATHAAATGASCVVGIGSGVPTGLLDGQPGGASCK